MSETILTPVERWRQAMADMVICYVLVRTDVPDFQWGKTAAQTHHCGSQMTEEKLSKNFADLNRLYDEWLRDAPLELAAAEAVEALAANKSKATDVLTSLQDVVIATREAADRAKRTFGTVLTLAVNAAEMRQTVSIAQLIGFHAGITHDPTYPIRVMDGERAVYTTLPVDTCAYIFGRKSALAPVLGQFDLLSERHIVR